MASRMIHYTVAKLITDKIEFKNKNQFLLGSLAPDMASYEVDSHPKGIHKIVHFYEKIEELGLKGYNWLTFYHKYLKDNADDEFAIGYFIHLICDNIWLKDIQVKYIYSTDRELLKNNIIKGYEDMKKCNYYIAENYGICYDVEPLESFTVDEANISYQISLLDDLKLDFLPYGDNFDLEIHNWNAIIGYIGKCVEICLREVQFVMDNKEPDSPLPYMISTDFK